MIWHDGRGACLFTKTIGASLLYLAITGGWSRNDLIGAAELLPFGN